MLNKAVIGSRIAILRRSRGFSQAALADILHISSQAVSKWETGKAVPDLEMLLSLSHLFGITINELLEGKDRITQISIRPFEKDGIAYFVPREERDYNKAWADAIVSGQWVKRNWEQQVSQPDSMRWIAQRICAHGGLILEIGTGPGGGYMPAVLLQDADAEVIISDLSPTVVWEWKRLFETTYFPPNVQYAALDHCCLPFKDQSIDVISSGGGFGNTEGDKGKALSEIYRVLKPGGLYVSGEGFVTADYLHSLPETAQQILLEKRPDIFEDYYAACVMPVLKPWIRLYAVAGLRKRMRVTWRTWPGSWVLCSSLPAAAASV